MAADWHAKMNVEVVALERPLCSADGGGPADGDEGFINVQSSSDTSSDSRLTIG